MKECSVKGVYVPEEAVYVPEEAVYVLEEASRRPNILLASCQTIIARQKEEWQCSQVAP